MILSNEKGAMIYVQRLDSVSPTALRGTEGADIVFWSPDGKDIGFWAEGRLKKIPADGGTALPICDLPSPWSATWNNSGVILASSPRVSSWIVTVKSGTVRPWKFVFWPKFLPDGRHVLYVNNDPKLGGFRCCVEDYVSGRITELMPTNTYVLFVPDQDGREEGHLLFCRSGTLLAQRFDARQVVISGEPAPVAQQVGFFSPTAGSAFDASADGVLIYASGSLKMRLNWVDRRGAELGTITDAVEFRSGLRLSPDNTKVAYDVADLSQGSTDIWVTDLRKGTTERETFEPGVEASAVWSPDSTRLAYGSAQASPPQLRMKTVGDQGSGEAFPPGPFQLPTDWSRDGRWIFYQTSGDDVNAQMWVASVSDRNLTPLLQTPFNNSFPTLSPNNEYLAFAANDTGRSEIYVQRFEGSNQPKLTGPRKRVSHEGGIMPRWRPDGKELFFVSRNRELMATEVRAGIEFGTPVLLFMLRKAIGPLSLGYESYDVSARGDRFLVPKLAASIEPLYVVANWQQALQ